MIRFHFKHKKIKKNKETPQDAARPAEELWVERNLILLGLGSHSSLSW
jgi:hypothetical protein